MAKRQPKEHSRQNLRYFEWWWKTSAFLWYRKDSDFKHKDVTTQAIHNELIKDKRFVLIGRGIYALAEWGYKKGTVSDIIADILTKEGGPLHRDEIVRRVLKSRQVRETTILLNLQSKSEFKRVAKATYQLHVEEKN